MPCPSLTSLVEFANFFEFVKVVKGSKKRIFYSQTDRKEEGGTIFGIRVFFMNANVVFIEKSEYFLKTFNRP